MGKENKKAADCVEIDLSQGGRDFYPSQIVPLSPSRRGDEYFASRKYDIVRIIKEGRKKLGSGRFDHEVLGRGER